MSEVLPAIMTKPEQYEALVIFGTYMAEIAKNVSVPKNKMNHLKNISDEINAILPVGDPLVYGPYTQQLLVQHQTYNQIVQDMHNGTIFDSDTYLDSWTYEYIKLHKTNEPRTFTKNINSFRNNTFTKKIEKYMNRLGIEYTI